MSEKQCIVELAMVHGSSNINGSHTAIEITDPESHAVIRIELDMETLGSLLHGGRDHKVRATFRNTEHWGKRVVRKSIKVYLKSPLAYDRKDEIVRKLAIKHEVDGWVFAGPQDSWSQSDHGYESKRQWVRLHFKKYIKPKKGEEQ